MAFAATPASMTFLKGLKDPFALLYFLTLGSKSDIEPLHHTSRSVCTMKRLRSNTPGIQHTSIDDNNNSTTVHAIKHC